VNRNAPGKQTLFGVCVAVALLLLVDHETAIPNQNSVHGSSSGPLKGKGGVLGGGEVLEPIMMSQP
jgi:hypothetical protein